MDGTSGVHMGTGRVDNHGDGGTDEAARTGQWVGIMEPDADWDVVLVSCGSTRAGWLPSDRSEPEPEPPYLGREPAAFHTGEAASSSPCWENLGTSQKQANIRPIQEPVDRSQSQGTD